MNAPWRLSAAAEGARVGYRWFEQEPSARGHGMEAVVMNDVAVFDHINALSAEEEELFASASDGSGLTTAASERLAEIKVELDRCYDLLHQREARRAAGLDPEDASLRPVEVVERYQQ